MVDINPFYANSIAHIANQRKAREASVPLYAEKNYARMKKIMPADAKTGFHPMGVML